MPVQLPIKRYEPRTEKRWDKSPEGARRAVLYEEEGLVEVFAFPGGTIAGRPHRAFTKFEMWIYPCVYTATLPRCYHDRWIYRLARDFAWECGKQAEEAAAARLSAAGL